MKNTAAKFIAAANEPKATKAPKPFSVTSGLIDTGSEGVIDTMGDIRRPKATMSANGPN
jgi:hypothetical protein